MWTEAEVSALTRHLDDGGSIDAAALMLGRQYKDVREFMQGNNLRPSARLVHDLAQNKTLIDLPDAPPVEGIDPFAGVTIEHLQSDSCRFIAGAPCGQDTLYCGRPIRLGYSYCPAHACLAYVRVQP